MEGPDGAARQAIWACPSCAETHADPKAGDAWLGSIEFGAADAVAVSDAHIDGVGEAGDGEVFTEVTGHQIVTVQVALPEVIRLGLVHLDGALLAAVSGEVALPIRRSRLRRRAMTGPSVGVFHIPV